MKAEWDSRKTHTFVGQYGGRRKKTPILPKPTFGSFRYFLNDPAGGEGQGQDDGCWEGRFQSQGVIPFSTE